MKREQEIEMIHEIITEIEQLENKVKAFVIEHKEKRGKWDRNTEKIMDKIVTLGTWVHDTIHNCAADPDEMNPVYRRSMLRRVRRALRYSF